MSVLEYPRLKLINLLLEDCLRSHLVSLYVHIFTWSISDIWFISIHTPRAQTHTPHTHAASMLMLIHFTPSCIHLAHSHLTCLHPHTFCALHTQTPHQPTSHTHTCSHKPMPATTHRSHSHLAHTHILPHLACTQPPCHPPCPHNPCNGCRGSSHLIPSLLPWQCQTCLLKQQEKKLAVKRRALISCKYLARQETVQWGRET